MTRQPRKYKFQQTGSYQQFKRHRAENRNELMDGNEKIENKEVIECDRTVIDRDEHDGTTAVVGSSIGHLPGAEQEEASIVVAEETSKVVTEASTPTIEQTNPSTPTIEQTNPPVINSSNPEELNEITSLTSTKKNRKQSDSSECSNVNDTAIIQIDRGFMMDSAFLHKLAKMVLFKRSVVDKGFIVGKEVVKKKRRGIKKGKIVIKTVESKPTSIVQPTPVLPQHSPSAVEPTVDVPSDSIPRKYKDSIQNTANDPRYLHFLKKVCGLGRSAAVKYITNQQKWLSNRNRKNKAEVGEKRRFSYERSGSSITIKSEADRSNRSVGKTSSGSVSKVDRVVGGSCETSIINILKDIKDCSVPSIDMNRFEYVVYKYGPDFSKLASSLGLSLREAILAYYLHGTGKQHHISTSLLETIVQNDWKSEDDRINFIQNFKRYGKKFWKYQIGRSEKDIKLFYRYYVRKGMPGFWSDEERRLFADVFKVYKKDWGKLAEVMGDKSIQEMKVYYAEYFRKVVLKGDGKT